MALVGLDGDWIRVNPALCRILGYSEKELLATNFQDIPRPDDLGTDPNFISRMLRGESRFCEMERRYVHKAGHVVHVALSVSLIYDKTAQPIFFLFQIQVGHELFAELLACRAITGCRACTTQGRYYLRKRRLHGTAWCFISR